MSNDVFGGRPFAPQPPVPSAQEAAERLQLALESGAVVGTWVWDIIADQLTGDERFARTFGLCPKLCAKGLPLELVIASIHPDDSARVDKSIEEALQSSETYRCEYRVLHEDGIYRWIEASGRIERDSRGKPIRSPGVLLDIDGRRTAEDERDRLNELLRIFTAAVPGVVYAKDLEGRMLVANRGTADLIGKPPEFFIGKTDLEFLDDQEQARTLMETDRRIMQSNVSEQIEEQVNLADGSAAIWLSTKAPLLDASGDVIGLIGSSIDVTARKKSRRSGQRTQPDTRTAHRTSGFRTRADRRRPASLAEDGCRRTTDGGHRP